ncbi:MAG: peptidoglycan LD-endopeptidase LytH [Actinomycetota bacterium]|nr:peptidoglycan LD-endopeptidase LytH [Actinomycetota bacterium]
MRRRLLTFFVALTGAALALPAVAGADTTTSTTSSSTTSTTAAPVTVPTTPGSTTTTTTPPSNQPPGTDGDGDRPPPVPQDPVAVPPADAPFTPSASDILVTKVLGSRLAQARRGLATASQARAAAAALVAQQQSEVDDLEAKVVDLQAKQARAVRLLQETHARLKRRALAAYTNGGNLEQLAVMSATSLTNYDRRKGFIVSLNRGDARAAKAYQEARKALGNDLLKLSDKLDLAKAALEGARSSNDSAVQVWDQKTLEYKMLQAGSVIAIGGFVFPVADPHAFSGFFGEPRAVGTDHEHTHQGIDIAAPIGTPLLACERGVLLQVGSDLYGGNSIWLVGASGARYYYAHLSAFAPNLHSGQVVAAGDVLGAVGSTGESTGPHLHFEIHPNGGPAIDGYPLLKTVDDATHAVRSKGPSH